MQPMPSSVADFKPADQLEDPLIEAARVLADQRAFGAVWTDDQLRVVSSAGAVPQSVVVGASVVDALIPLFGLEGDMIDLRAQAKPKPLRIPNTTVVGHDGKQSRRLNITVFWVQSRNRYLVLLGAIPSQGPPTAELDQEIRRRRLIEQDLAAKSLEYARINQQLEEFAYVISHDLNAPLRALRYLSSDVDAAMTRIDPEMTNPDMAAVRDGAQAIAFQTRRMSRMMTDLLEYARIGRVQEAVEPVETGAMIAEIVASLKPTTTLSLIVKGDWPTIDTAAAPLDLVLRNLVENAVKHHDRPHGHVVVSAETVGRYVAFHIEDDGRGIPVEWHAAIFEPFRKVDDAHHPDSSGIGLALVKKTVTTLGGGIDVVSAAPEGRGTTFIVRWPLKLAVAEELAVDFR